MDIEILLWLQEFREAIGGVLNGFFQFLSTVAVDYYALVPALILFWVVDKRAGLYGLNSYGIACVENATLKSAFCVYRPWIRDNRVAPPADILSGASGYSFPSGHSSSSSGFYGGLIAYYRRHKALCILFAVIVALTMFSRIYFGVHTPQDILVGLATGVAAALLVVAADRFVTKHPKLDWVIPVIATAVSAAVLLFVSLKTYPVDYVDGKVLVDPASMAVNSFKDPGRFFGIVWGWFIERRFIRFEISGTKAEKVFRAVLGGFLFVFYWTTVVSAVGKIVGNGVVHFFLQASAPFLFMTVYPLCFKKKKAASEKAPETAVKEA